MSDLLKLLILSAALCLTIAFFRNRITSFEVIVRHTSNHRDAIARALQKLEETVTYTHPDRARQHAEIDHLTIWKKLRDDATARGLVPKKATN